MVVMARYHNFDISKNETSHIEALYRSLIRLPKARDLWRLKLHSPEHHVTDSYLVQTKRTSAPFFIQ